MNFLQLGIPLVYLWAMIYTPESSEFNFTSTAQSNHKIYSEIPVAVNDTFVLPIGCETVAITGNMMDNDYVLTKSAAKVNRVIVPQIGLFSCGPNGNFIYKWDKDFFGELTLTYRLALVEDPKIYSEATITIYVDTDCDCDNISDQFDIDDDNDGILDFHEGDEYTDTDGDGVPNRLDIDSDNDGITDYTEWQEENSTIQFKNTDENNDGWDDAFDAALGGEYYESIDTDLDGIPDFLDSDSDNDKVSDFIEAFNVNNDTLPNVIFSGLDKDNDGLDDFCDTVYCDGLSCNASGSNSPLPDFNENGIRDWRDVTNFYVTPKDMLARVGEKLHVYPNPITSSCLVSFIEELDEGPYELCLFSLDGKLIVQEKVQKMPFRLNMENREMGTYILHLQSKQQSLSSKILKAR